MDNDWNDYYPFARQDKVKQMGEDLSDFSSLENYMKQVFSKALPASFFPNIVNSPTIDSRKNKKKEMKYQVFNLHDYVIVHIPIERELNLKNAKIYHTSSELTLEGIPNSGDKQVIHLPSLVQHKRTKAILKNNMLEIRIPKVQDSRLTHIDVQKK